MRMTIDSTSVIVLINDRPCRVWEGMTEDGKAVRAYIAICQFTEACDELLERPQPSGAITNVWPRLEN